MADRPSEKPDVAAPVADAQEAAADKAEVNQDGPSPAEETKSPKPSEKSAEPPVEEHKEEQEKASADVEMKDATEAPAAEQPEAEGSTAPADADADAATATATVATPVSKPKPRRKSMPGESARKALNRKGSKARLTHLDAKPGDHFLVKLKGFPAWPAIICDESMLPQALVESRPQTAPRPDGTWLEQYADGGKRINDRNFPVMYLYTNEFGWVANTNLSELTPEKAEASITEKMRKDLREAYLLAAEHHPIDFYKEVLKNFLEDLEQAMREAAATPKKSRKGKAKAPVVDVEEDVEMAEVEEAPQEKPKASKKRKAEEEANTPQRSESVKKPKIKLNTSTPKAANGSATPKAKEESAVKSKPKIKKSKDAAEKKQEVPKEPKMTPEERHTRKKKEVLYLRHKLQRGLLTRDQVPQETEMKSMSEYVTMLENFVDLEVSIIRETKINKVLKAILKMEAIPREDEYHFKPRSQALLDKWNKLMSTDAGSAPAATTNGLNASDEAKAEKKEGQSNGVRKEAEEAKEPSSEKPVDAAETKAEKAEPKSDELADEKPTSDEVVAPPEPVEAAA